MFSHYFAHYAFDRDSDAWQIGFRDFPEWQTACYKREDIELEAQESLLAAIAATMDEGLPLPAPSPLQAEGTPAGAGGAENRTAQRHAAQKHR